MHNLKDIRKNLDFFKKKIKERNVEVNFENLINLDQQNRDLISKKEKLEHEKNYYPKQKMKKISKI